MSSPIPISTDEISQYQIETALDNFSNLKTKVGEAVRAFLASVKFDTAKITNETLTRFLETHLENLNILFTEELFSDPEFFKNLASSESSDKQSSSTNTPDVDTLSNAIIKEILPSIYENNVQLSTSAVQSSSKPVVPTSNINESNSSTQIPSKNVTAISPKTSITSIHRISYVSQMRAESSVLLGALAITLDKLQGITTTISRQAVVSTTVATAAPLMLSKKMPSIFKPKHKGLKLKNVFSKASILKVISPIGKMFTFLIKGSLKLLVGTVKLIGKGIVYVSKLIVNLAKTIIDLGKQVFKKIGQGLAGLFKSVKKAFVFSAKRIGKIFKAVFIDSKIGLGVLLFALGFIYEYIKTKFFSEGTFIDGLKKMLDSIVPTLPKFGKKEKDKDAGENDDDSSFLDFVGNAVKATALAIYNKLNSPLTDDDVNKAKALVEQAQAAVDMASPVPVPVQITLSIIDWAFEKFGIKLNLQENSIHYTNVIEVLFKGKTDYSKILENNKNERQQQFDNINKSITEFGKKNVGEGKLNILYDSVIEPLFKSITTTFNTITGKISEIINEKFKSIIDSIKNFNLEDLTKKLSEYGDILTEVTADFAKQLVINLDHIFKLLGAKAGGTVAGAALGILKWFGPVGTVASVALNILGPLVGSAFGGGITRYLQNEVGKLKSPEEHIDADDRFLSRTRKYLTLPTEEPTPTENSLRTNLTNPLPAKTESSDDSQKSADTDLKPTIPDGSTDTALPLDKKTPLKKSSTIPKVPTIKTPAANPSASSKVDKTAEIKKPSRNQIYNTLRDLVTNDTDPDNTKLTPPNIIEILSNPDVKLDNLKTAPFKITEDWVDKTRFKNIKSMMFRGILKKMISESGKPDEPFEDNEIFTIKHLFMSLSDPSSQIYKTLSEDVTRVLSKSGYRNYIDDVIENMHDSPIKAVIPISGMGRDGKKYLNINSLPIGILFNKINNRKINMGRGASMSTQRLFNLLISDYNLFTGERTHKGNSETLMTTDTVNTILGGLKEEAKVDYRRIVQKLEKFFAPPPPDPEEEKLKEDAAKELARTERLKDVKPETPAEKPLVASISTPATPPVTNDFEKPNYRFGDTSNIQNNIFLGFAQSLG